MSKCLLAFTKAFTTCSEEVGSTLLSISPITISTRPCSFAALSTFDAAAYSGPIGQLIHNSFHQILSMRLSWQPLLVTATL